MRAASFALPAQASGIDSVRPKAETAPLFDDEAGGNADADAPAIWRDPADPGRSLVIATAKQGGLGPTTWTRARCGRSPPRPGRAPMTSPAASTTSTWCRACAWAACARTSRWSATAAGTVDYRQVRTLDLPSSFRLPNGASWTPCAEPGELPQVEGMVVDPADGTLYAGREDVGIWRIDVGLTGTPVLIDKVREYGVPGTYDEQTEECTPGIDPGFDGTHPTADVEGLTLVNEPGGDGYLLASSQGDDTFVAYDRERDEDNEYENAFRIAAASPTLDGSEVCDGAAALNAPLGTRYPDGLLVVQDGEETPGDGDREATGFKFVDLGEVDDAVD